MSEKAQESVAVDVAPAAAAEAPKKSKSEQKKNERQERKDKARAQRGGDASAQRGRGQQQSDPSEEKGDNFGKLPLITSATKSGRVYTKVSALNAELAGQTVWIRARLFNSRGKGNLFFLVLRQKFSTVQAVVAKSDTITKNMLKFVGSISKESIVDVEGEIAAATVLSSTQKDVELKIKSIFVVSMAANLPLQVSDVEIPQPLLDAQEETMNAISEKIAEEKAKLDASTDEEEKKSITAKLDELTKEKSTAQKYVAVTQKERLDNRIIDLRSTTNQAIFRVQAGVCQLFRDYLISQDFTEIHTPKLIGAASEGGADVFKVQYFQGNAYLAQSPQLYKQMAICGDLDRVFEIGHVFRAENSMTHRHLTEFIGLDLEMAFTEHYHEVLDILDQMFITIFDGLKSKFSAEIEAVKKQFPFEDLQYHKPQSLRLQFKDAIALLREDGVEADDLEDLSTAQERRLGELVKIKYSTDFFILDKFPTNARTFYTMEDPADPNYTNAYDFFIRGQEILSGGQRIHDPALLTEKAIKKGVAPESIQPYIDAFKFGAPPHGGGGIGLERVVMLYLGLNEIRRTSMFPRDPTRLSP